MASFRTAAFSLFSLTLSRRVVEINLYPDMMFLDLISKAYYGFEFGVRPFMVPHDEFLEQFRVSMADLKKPSEAAGLDLSLPKFEHVERMWVVYRKLASEINTESVAIDH